MIATHDIEAAAACDYTMLLARRLVAFGPSAQVLRADVLLETFGVIGKTEGDSVVVLGRSTGTTNAAKRNKDGCNESLIRFMMRLREGAA